MAAAGGLVDYLVLENPGEVVGDEDGVDASAESRVDVGAGTVADHPCVAAVAGMVGDESAVGGGMLLVKDFGRGEVAGRGRNDGVCGLLFEVAFGDEDEAMAGGEVGESFFDFGEEFDLLLGDGLGEGFDAAVFLFSDGLVGELLEAGDEGSAEAVETIAVGEDGGLLNGIEVAADLFGSVDAVVEVRDEAGDGALEVDVVFPEGVVSVDEQGLIGRLAEGLTQRLGRGGHRLIIKV